MADDRLDGQARGRAFVSNAEDFARRLRLFALDARRALHRADGPLDELLALHRAAWQLLREPDAAPPGEARRWLLAAQQAIGDRMASWSLDDLESLAAWPKAAGR